jgi:carboxyl-terminal processing protease
MPWLQQAKEAENRGAWLQACRCYDEALRQDRKDTKAQKGYQRCLRRLQLVARHSDPVYRQALGRLTQTQALATYEQVLGILIYAYPDRARTDPTLLFQQGLHEARLALDDPVFKKRYLAGVKPAVLSAFRARLHGWAVPRMTRPSEAREQVWNVLRQATKDGLATRSTFGNALALEFAAGACNGLDEYSSFLTPSHLALVQSAVRGKTASVGLEVGWSDGKLKVTRIYPKGPAQEADLRPGDEVLQIGGQPVKPGLTSEAAAGMLRGAPGSVVKVEFQPADPNRGGKQTASLKRRAVSLPAVEFEVRQTDDCPQYGYLRINYFNDSTLQEVRDVLIGPSGMSGGMPEIKGLILDLRGNPGGVFASAVAVAELFLSGVIVIGQSPLPDYNRNFKGEANAPFQFPIVVLVDGDTASSAEVLAAALKESRSTPTRLVGQPTFGKGSVQCLIQLKKAPLEKAAAIRLTVARLFSPSNQPLTGKGVTPDVPVKVGGDIMAEAHKVLKGLINNTPAPAPAMGEMARAPAQSEST